MKMKLSDILALNTALRDLIDNTNGLHIDTSLKFKFLGIIKSIEIPVTNFNIIRNDKIKEYGKEDENGNISIPYDDEESIKKFTEELNKVLLSDVKINIEQIDAETIFSAGIPYDYLVNLYPIMKE